MSVLNPNHAPTPAEREILNTELTETLGKIGVSVAVISSGDLRQLIISQYLPEEEK